eukprot:669723-Rhodomonas_salina.1
MVARREIHGKIPNRTHVVVSGIQLWVDQVWQHRAIKDGSSQPEEADESCEGPGQVAVGEGAREGKKEKKKKARGRGGR